jgi:hypothetical protein
VVVRVLDAQWAAALLLAFPFATKSSSFKLRGKVGSVTVVAVPMPVVGVLLGMVLALLLSLLLLMMEESKKLLLCLKTLLGQERLRGRLVHAVKVAARPVGKLGPLEFKKGHRLSGLLGIVGLKEEVLECCRLRSGLLLLQLLLLLKDLQL